MIGQDGRRLFALLEEDPALTWTRNMPAVETLRCVWLQHLYAEEPDVRWREAKDLPPSRFLIYTPCDPEALNHLDWVQSPSDREW